MKKNFIRLLIISSFTLFITGCVKYNADMEIKKDKSMLFTIIGAYDVNQFSEDVIKNTINSEQKHRYESKGYLVEEYNDGNYKGYKLTLDIGNIDDLSTIDDVQINLSEISNISKIFKIKKGIFANKYTAKIKFDFNNIEESNSGSDYGDIEDIIDNNLDVSFSVKLPYKHIKTNAFSSKKRKLTWRLENKKVPDIMEFEFYIYNIKLIAFLGVGILAIILIIIFVLLIKYRGNNKTMSNKSTNKNINIKETKIKTTNENLNEITNNKAIEPPKSDEVRKEFISIADNDIVENNTVIIPNITLKTEDKTPNNSVSIDFEIPDPIITNNPQSKPIDSANENPIIIEEPIEKIVINEPLETEKIVISEPSPKQDKLI